MTTSKPDQPAPPTGAGTEGGSLNRPCSAHPTIIVGWPTIARLAHGQTVTLENATLIPDDLLFNTAAKVLRGDFGACECTEPREVICNGHRCGACGQMIRPEGVKEHTPNAEIADKGSVKEATNET